MTGLVKITNKEAYNFRLDEIADVIKEAVERLNKAQALCDAYVLEDKFARNAENPASDIAAQLAAAQEYVGNALITCENARFRETEEMRRADRVLVERA